MLDHYFTEAKNSDDVVPGELPENINKNREPDVLPGRFFILHLFKNQLVLV